MAWSYALGRPPRVVVTGGAGFIGSLLARELLAAGYEVLVYDNLSYGGQSLLPLFIHDRFRFVEADILDASALASALEGADAVVHLAALVGYPLCKKLPELAERVSHKRALVVGATRGIGRGIALALARAGAGAAGRAGMRVCERDIVAAAKDRPRSVQHSLIASLIATHEVDHKTSCV